MRTQTCMQGCMHCNRIKQTRDVVHLHYNGPVMDSIWSVRAGAKPGTPYHILQRLYRAPTNNTWPVAFKRVGYRIFE